MSGRVPAGLGIETVLAVALSAAPELRRKLVALVDTLNAHDRAHGTHLVRTLQAYVEADRSVSATAKRLGVHRHTVVNRLEQAERVLGRSLRSGRDRYILEFALLAGRPPVN